MAKKTFKRKLFDESEENNLSVTEIPTFRRFEPERLIPELSAETDPLATEPLNLESPKRRGILSTPPDQIIRY